MYTLQSIKTGNYIDHLFEDKHNKIFGTRDLTKAYEWSSLDKVTKVKNEIGQCLIIKLEK